MGDIKGGRPSVNRSYIPRPKQIIDRDPRGLISVSINVSSLHQTDLARESQLDGQIIWFSVNHVSTLPEKRLSLSSHLGDSASDDRLFILSRHVHSPRIQGLIIGQSFATSGASSYRRSQHNEARAG